MTYKFNENQCAFCKSEVQPGATVCAHCGAYKGSLGETWSWLSMVGMVLLFPAILFGATSGFRGMKTEDFLLVTIPIVLLVLLCLLAAKRTWLRRN